ncbi:DUF541 domain-containing protein [Silicimonas algicola]|nr:DUF541 domain-containing protein [Silicimonas algicola]
MEIMGNHGFRRIVLGWRGLVIFGEISEDQARPDDVRRQRSPVVSLLRLALFVSRLFSVRLVAGLRIGRDLETVIRRRSRFVVCDRLGLRHHVLVDDGARVLRGLVQRNLVGNADLDDRSRNLSRPHRDVADLHFGRGFVHDRRDAFGRHVHRHVRNRLDSLLGCGRLGWDLVLDHRHCDRLVEVIHHVRPAEVRRPGEIGPRRQRRVSRDAQAARLGEGGRLVQRFQSDGRDARLSGGRHLPVDLEFVEDIGRPPVQRAVDVDLDRILAADVDIHVKDLVARQEQHHRIGRVVHVRGHGEKPVFDVWPVDLDGPDLSPRLAVPAHEPDGGHIKIVTPAARHDRGDSMAPWGRHVWSAANLRGCADAARGLGSVTTVVPFRRFPMRLATLILTLGLAALPMTLSAQEARTIVVTGEGRIAAEPDMAVINLGVMREAATAGEAMSAASEAAAAVLVAVTEAGIEPRDVQTSSLNLQPRWDHSDQNGARITGYIANNDLMIRVRDLDALGALLDTLVTTGANTINGLSFSVAEPRPLEDEARTAAVADARAKAERLAAAGGVTLGEVTTISEATMPPMPFPYPQAEMRMAASDVPIARGEIETVVTVTVVFSIAAQ